MAEVTVIKSADPVTPTAETYAFVRPETKFIDAYTDDRGREHKVLDYGGIRIDVVPAMVQSSAVLYVLGKLQSSEDEDDPVFGNLESSEDDPAAVMRWIAKLYDLVFGERQAFDILTKMSKMTSAAGLNDNYIMYSDLIGYVISEVGPKN